MRRSFRLLVISWKKPVTLQYTLFIFQAAGNNKYRRKVKAFTFSWKLLAVTKISTVYKFHKDRVATDAIGTGNFKR